MGIDGNWNLVIPTPMGDHDGALSCQVDGNTLTGTMTGPAGAMEIQNGTVELFGGDLRHKDHRRRVCSRIAYMPQGLGKNLYPTLSVAENLDFFARLYNFLWIIHLFIREFRNMQQAL